MKVINNAVAAANTAVVAEALLAGARAGADLDALVTVMERGLGRVGDARAEAGPDARPRLHDAVQARAHAEGPAPLPARRQRRPGVRMELVEETAEILAEADERGLGEQDFAALLEVVEERAGARLEPRR